MFTNLSPQLLVLFTDKFSLSKLFFLEQWDESNILKHQHRKIASARKIQHNWRLYVKLKKLKYSFALYPENYSPSGSFNSSRIDNVYLVITSINTMG
jgi:hypothetical protein